MWQSLGLVAVLASWAALGFIAGCAALAATRGRAGLAVLPLAIAAAMGGGALVPALGGKDAFGFGISLLIALAASTAAVIAVFSRAPRAINARR